MLACLITVARKSDITNHCDNQWLIGWSLCFSRWCGLSLSISRLTLRSCSLREPWRSLRFGLGGCLPWAFWYRKLKKKCLHMNSATLLLY